MRANLGIYDAADFFHRPPAGGGAGAAEAAADRGADYRRAVEGEDIALRIAHSLEDMGVVGAKTAAELKTAAEVNETGREENGMEWKSICRMWSRK